MLIQKQQHDAYTQHQTLFFTIKTKKEEAINFVLEIFYYCDPLYYNKLKGTSNKFCLKNILLL